MTKILQHTCPIEALTPKSSSFFFGFHDLCPWNPANSEVALLGYSGKIKRVPNGTDWADVCIWNPGTDEIRAIARTTAWNFQQGARLRWLSDGTLMFSVLENGVAKSRVIDGQGRIQRELPMAVAALSPDESLAVSPSFGRLARYWKAYGYAGAAAPGLVDRCPKEDGLWAMNMETGSIRLLFSLADLATDSLRTTSETDHFISHPLFNRSGTRIAFLHRFFSADGALFTRLFVCRSDGSALKMLASEKVSHFDWKDEDTLVVWSRFAAGGLGKLRARGVLDMPGISTAVRYARKLRGSFKAALLSEYYHLISVNNPERRKKVAPDVLVTDGHPMMHPNRQLMVSDTYPDPQGILHLFIYDFDSATYVGVGTFEDGVISPDTDLKCDLHPRWDRLGEKIAVDICEQGVRRLAIVDARPALAALVA